MKLSLSLKKKRSAKFCLLKKCNQSGKINANVITMGDHRECGLKESQFGIKNIELPIEKFVLTVRSKGGLR